MGAGSAETAFFILLFQYQRNPFEISTTGVTLKKQHGKTDFEKRRDAGTQLDGIIKMADTKETVSSSDKQKKRRASEFQGEIPTSHRPNYVLSIWI